MLNASASRGSVLDVLEILHHISYQQASQNGFSGPFHYLALGHRNYTLNCSHRGYEMFATLGLIGENDDGPLASKRRLSLLGESKVSSRQPKAINVLLQAQDFANKRDETIHSSNEFGLPHESS